MSDKHPMRTAIVGGTIALVIGTLIINLVSEPARQFFRAIWHVVTVVGAAVWSLFTAPIPVWAVLLIGVAVALAVRVYRALRAPPPSVAIAARIAAGLPPRTRDALADAILRRLALADGAELTINVLSQDLHTTRLRVEQALDRLAEIGLVKAYQHIVDGPRFGLTPEGRDDAIARGYDVG
jgi:hypothetical protein